MANLFRGTGNFARESYAYVKEYGWQVKKVGGKKIVKFGKLPGKRKIRAGMPIAIALATVLAGSAAAGKMIETRPQTAIPQSKAARAANIAGEKQTRVEYLTAMERQKALNRKLHTRKYLDRFWKYLRMKTGPNLTEEEQRAEEKFSEEHPVLPLTHMVVTIENNPPEEKQSEDAHVTQELNGNDPRKGVVLAAAYQEARTNRAYRRAMKKLQQRGRDYPGFAKPSAEFMQRALNEGIKGLPPEAPELLSRVNESWTGSSRLAKGVGNMLPGMHLFNPSLTPFIPKGAIGQKNGKWTYRTPAAGKR